MYEEYLNVVRSCGAKDLTDRRVADYIWELDNTGLTISRISSKRYGKERVVRLGVPINIMTRILERLKMVDCGSLLMHKQNRLENSRTLSKRSWPRWKNRIRIESYRGYWGVLSCLLPKNGANHFLKPGSVWFSAEAL